MTEKDLEKIDENLEILWSHLIEDGKEFISVKELPFHDDLIIRAMAVDKKYINLEQDKISMTDEGKQSARNIVRRHRLSERLFSDLLGTTENLHHRACIVEHVITEGLEDRVCEILGHPRTCPHGKKIPNGKCCRNRRRDISKKIMTIADLPLQTKAKVIYVLSEESGEINKLVSMGVEPGADIYLERRFPTYIFKIGHTKFAVDKQIAESIFVRSY